MGELAPGTVVGPYEIRSTVGTGPSGTVYAAVRPETGLKFALKVLHPHISRPGPALERFETIVARLVKLVSPGLVRVVEAGRLPGAGSKLCVVSEFLTGQPLTDLLAASGELTLEEAAPLLASIAVTLTLVHHEGIIHGGLTPENVWVTPREDGKWPPLGRVMDFGTAALHGKGSSLAEERPYYLSPEQCRGEPATASSDIYAFGVLAFQMLTGRLPFSSPIPREVIRMHLEETPRLPGPPLLPAFAVDLVLRSLEKSPGRRPPSFVAVKAALEVILRPLTPPPQPAVLPRATQTPAPAAGAVGVSEPRRDVPAEPVGPRAEKPAPAAGKPSPRLSPVIVSQPGPGSPGDLAVATGVLPKRELPAKAKPFDLGPILYTLLGVMTAVAIFILGYRLLTDRWPW
jgi:serine/threonine protein kinase